MLSHHHIVTSTCYSSTPVAEYSLSPEEVSCLFQAVHAEQVEHQAVAGGELALQRLRASSNDAVPGLSTLKPAAMGEEWSAAEMLLEPDAPGPAAVMLWPASAPSNLHEATDEKYRHMVSSTTSNVSSKERLKTRCASGLGPAAMMLCPASAPSNLHETMGGRHT
jgi:hypothetical protein